MSNNYREKEVICTICPLSCHIKLKIDEAGEITEISGAKCEKGEEYAVKEFKFPERVLTATVRTNNEFHPLLSVRSESLIPKKLLKECMIELANIEVSSPIRIGDVVLENICNTGVNIIATQSME